MPPTADKQQLLHHLHDDDDDQLANDDAALMSSSAFAVQEPPVGEEAAAERQAEVCRLLAGFRRHLGERTARHLGYPYNLDLERRLSSTPELAAFQGLCINNLGDPLPLVESNNNNYYNYGVHSRPVEVAVLDWFARLWGLRRRDAYWGYVTACGTEGNLQGLLLGRELLPDGALIYASADSHYSVFKAARMYRVRCVKVGTLVSGEMGCGDFRAKLMQNAASPAIVNVNIGTTVKGAVDDLDTIISTLQDCGFRRGRFYIHCDGALAGLMLPFIKQSILNPLQAPKVTFDKPIGSVSVSGHKFLGCPVPCGEHAAALDANATTDTITGSRNGHAPLFLWHALTTKGRRGIRDDVQRCLGNTVVLERPRDEAFVRRWQLACQGDIAHVVVMPSVGLHKIHAFVDDLAAERSIWYRRHDAVPCVAKDIGQHHCLCGRLHP